VLTSEQSIIVYDRGEARPDRLTRRAHAHYVAYAERMIAAYHGGVGRTRRELHKAVEAILAGEPDCDRRRVAAFCKVMDELGTFNRDERGEAAKLRVKVFTIAAKYHPLVTVATPGQMFERTESEVKGLVAAELGRPWDEIDAALYADVIDQQRMESFAEPADVADVLSRYNVGQLQACLYRATRVTVEASADLAAIVRRAKLCGLLLEIRRIDAERQVHRIELSGPAGVLRESRRYGVNFARFVPTLLACRGEWSMRARVVTPWGASAELRLRSGDGYRSHLAAPAEFDSDVEARLASDWGESRSGWKLIREAGVLHEGQATFVPDFLLRHEDGREAWLEVVGFWTPQYLANKRRTLARFAGRRIVLAVQRRAAKEGAEETRGVVVYRTKVDPDDVVRAAEESDWASGV
jgi:predicted nuclease of restriction endonuclease-like RecB superfamily